MAAASPVTMVRHVAVWYYALTGVTALVAVGWMAHRRLLALGRRLLAAGIALNAAWELMLFTVWGRHYETVVPTIVHAGYQSLTECGPLLVLAVLLLDSTGVIDVSAWRETTVTAWHRLVRLGAWGLALLLSSLCVGSVVAAPELLVTPITVHREISLWYFAGTASLAVAVLSSALWQRNKPAVVLFVTLGTFNVLFEIIGLVGGYRSYHGLIPVASLFVGLSESGTAGALVWLIVESSWFPNRFIDRSVAS